MARARTDARMMSSAASNALFFESERLSPSRMMINVKTITITPRSEI